MNTCIHSAIAPNMNRCINCGKVWTDAGWANPEPKNVRLDQSIECNEGYNACLHGIKRALNPYMPHDSVPAIEWFKGWDLAARNLKGKR